MPFLGLYIMNKFYCMTWTLYNHHTMYFKIRTIFRSWFFNRKFINVWLICLSMDKKIGGRLYFYWLFIYISVWAHFCHALKISENIGLYRAILQRLSETPCQEQKIFSYTFVRNESFLSFAVAGNRTLLFPRWRCVKLITPMYE